MQSAGILNDSFSFDEFQQRWKDSANHINSNDTLLPFSEFKRIIPFDEEFH